MGVGTTSLEVEPKTSLNTDPLRIKATGLRPGSHAELVLEMTDESEINWESAATFKVDADGVVDPALKAPVSGSYKGVDPTGLFWSLAPVSELPPGGAFPKSLEPLRFTAHLQLGETRVSMKSFERLRVAPGVTRQEVRSDGVTGTLFLPEGDEIRPAIIVLSGSEGGTYEPVAAQFASRGYVALAVAYFGIGDLPKELVNVPVETVAEAVSWLESQPRAKSDAIGVWGASKGAELALLSASLFPKIKAVVAKSASAYVFEGIGAQMGRVHRSSWTYEEQPLPFIPLGFNVRIGAGYFWSKMRKKPWPTEPMYSQALKKNKSLLDLASIPVGGIEGPVLVTSGGRDGVWPSSRMADIIMRKRSAAGHEFADAHLDYPGAGHQVGSPYSSTIINYLAMPDDFVEFLGGTPESNAAASNDSWPKINEFMDKALGFDRPA
jgi:dienelactone hydrolase